MFRACCDKLATIKKKVGDFLKAIQSAPLKKCSRDILDKPSRKLELNISIEDQDLTLSIP